MTHAPRHVAVIGAGPSGLVAIKELQQAGHRVTCFEQADDLGGVFRFTEGPGGVYESVRLVSSAAITCFSDFPPPRSPAAHLTHREYLQYLRDYAAHFGLRSVIKFRHAVTRMDPLAGGGWELRVRDEAAGQELAHRVDAVAVCSGVHQHPVMPRLEHQDVFQGEILHSYRYKRAAPFRGKRVVVVGLGESASDLVEEISQVAQECVLSIRRGVLIVPRLMFGEPNDYYTSRLFYTLPNWFVRVRHAARWHWPSVVLAVLFYLALQTLLQVLIGLLHRLGDVSGLARLTLIVLAAGFAAWLLVRTVKYLLIDANPRELLLAARLMRQSGAGHGEQFATKTMGAVRAIVQGRCRLKPAIRSFTREGVEFIDGSRQAADVVLFCTGFSARFSFLEREAFDVRQLYKNCFDGALGPTCCFLGLARPAIGAIPPIAEMQARWFARVLSGDASLPSPEQMAETIRQDAAEHRRLFRVVTDRLPGLVDYTSYMDQLADFIGCKPRFAELWREPRLLWWVYSQPFSGHQYRLRGPQHNKAMAVQCLRRIGMSPVRAIYAGALILLVLIAEGLYRIGFAVFKPLLRL